MRLVRGVAGRDAQALVALYDRAHRAVFTLIARITSNGETAEELTLEVFLDVWRQAAGYEAANGSVLAWIMNQARSRAIERLRRQQQDRASDANPDAGLMTIDAPDYLDVLKTREQRAALETAIRELTAEERQTIEAAFFSEMTRAAVAARFQVSPEVTAMRMRSALHKLRRALMPKAKGRAPASAPVSPCAQTDVIDAYALRALPPAEAAAAESHLAICSPCQRELWTLRPVIDALVAWPTDVLRPSASLRERLARRLASLCGSEPVLPERQWSEAEWETVAPGIDCKLLSADTERHRISMLVRLVPGGQYPAHTHAGREELHLLDGELWIDDRKLVAGDYNRAEAGTGDKRVWSETGCSCFLMTSTKDVLA